MRKDARILFPLFLIVGCSQGDKSVRAPSGAPGDPLSLTGPGGTVRIGDSLAQAMAAFPAPKGVRAEDSDIMTKPPRRLWLWRTQTKPGKYFDAIAENGKIVRMSLSETGRGASSQTMARLGPPSIKLEGKRGTLSGWEVSNHARWEISYQDSGSDPQPTVFVGIGRKSELGPMPTKAEELDVVVDLVESIASSVKYNDKEFGGRPEEDNPGKG
ncbi:MAG: hypothetical protein ACO1SV_20495 [Fimbriimonas sp.]